MIDRQFEPESANFAFVRDIPDPGAVVIYVFNDIDFCSAPAFEEWLIESTRVALVTIVDVSECRFIDAAGISVLLRAHRQLGDRLRIVAPETSATYRLLALVELLDVLSVHRSVWAARAADRYPRLHLVKPASDGNVAKHVRTSDASPFLRATEPSQAGLN